MAVTLESLTVSALQAQPLGYDGTDTVNGLVARRWNIQGLVRPAEWLDLLQVFETWQGSRLSDPDTLVSLDVGTTVSFSGSALGYSWSNVACWFAKAPEAEVVGAYVGVSFELLDAEQSLAVLLRQLESEVQTAESSVPDYGTLTLGAATLTLTEQPDGYAEGPQLQRTAAGGVVINGPLGVIRAKSVRGYTDSSGWSALQSWYETTAATTPVSGAFYPSAAPRMNQELVVINGVKTTRCNIEIELWEIP